MTLLFLILIIGVSIPTALALIVSWREMQLRNLSIKRHAPRTPRSATIVLYHTEDQGTLRSIQHLRRIRAARLRIIVVIPYGFSLNVPLPSDISIRHKHRPASFDMTVASCYPMLRPNEPLGIISSGDTLTAPIIHTTLATLHTRKDTASILCRRAPTKDLSYTGIMVWFHEALRHAYCTLRTRSRLHARPGLWLRDRSPLINSAPTTRLYIPALAIGSSSPSSIPRLHWGGTMGALILLAAALPCYAAAARLQTSLPLITFWVLCGWWLNVLISLMPEKSFNKILPAASAPLGGILIPAWCVILLGLTLQRRLGQWFSWARRQYVHHGILFRLRHP